MLKGISIHAPLTGSDLGFDMYGFCFCDFNPRSPYGERRLLERECSLLFHFNPRSPYGERLSRLCASRVSKHISIHAPLTGSDASASIFDLCFDSFQSTLPLRGATCRGRRNYTFPWNFNPRSPYGERLRLSYLTSKDLLFQSTLPLRGATEL